MARNQVQFQKGLSEASFAEIYGTEEQCHAALVKWRWPNGFECPGCQGADHCVVTRGARRLFQCNACRKQTSVKAGTFLRFEQAAAAHLVQDDLPGHPIKEGHFQYRTRSTPWRHPDGRLDDEAQARSSHAGA